MQAQFFPPNARRQVVGRPAGPNNDPDPLRRCTTGKLKGLVVGCIIDNDNRPVGAGLMTEERCSDILDIPSLVEGGNDNGEAGLRKCCVD